MGLAKFSEALELNGGIVFINLSRNKEVNEDEEGLKRFADALKLNQFLKTIDFSGIRLPKIILK
jgi:hypothetical protein